MSEPDAAAPEMRREGRKSQRGEPAHDKLHAHMCTRTLASLIYILRQMHAVLAGPSTMC